MFEQYKYYKFCMWGVREASEAENVTWEVSGSHFRFVSETFWVRVFLTGCSATMKTMRHNGMFSSFSSVYSLNE